MAKIKIDIASGKVAKAAVVVGIDLGTTNSLVAFVNPQTHQPEIIVDEMGSLVPSVIGFQPGQLPQVGYIAKEGLIASPDRTIYSVKRLLGRSYKDVSDVQSFLSYRIIDDETDALVKVMIDDAFYNPIELSAIILKSLKQKAEKSLGADVVVDHDVGIAIHIGWLAIHNDDVRPVGLGTRNDICSRIHTQRRTHHE